MHEMHERDVGGAITQRRKPGADVNCASSIHSNTGGALLVSLPTKIHQLNQWQSEK